MRLVKGDQEVEVDEGNHTLVGYYLGEGFAVDSAVSPAGGLAGFPLVFDGAQYLDATGVPEPERVGQPDGAEFAELSVPADVEQLPDGQFATLPDGPIESPGTGEPMAGVEHPADGSLSPEISND